MFWNWELSPCAAKDQNLELNFTRSQCSYLNRIAQIACPTAAYNVPKICILEEKRQHCFPGTVCSRKTPLCFLLACMYRIPLLPCDADCRAIILQDKKVFHLQQSLRVHPQCRLHFCEEPCTGADRPLHIVWPIIHFLHARMNLVYGLQ